MKRITLLVRACSLSAIAAMLASCSANGASTIPHTTQANLSTNVLQLAVGTANIGQDGTVGLNVVATLRSTSGGTAVLADQPTLTGPSGFTVPATATGAYIAGTPGLNTSTNPDIGTAHLTGSPQVPLNNSGLVQSTFGTFTGVFSNGFGPLNSDQTVTSGAYYPGNPNNTEGNGFTSSAYETTSMIAAITGGADAFQPMPFFSTDPMVYLTGPPAVPFFNNGTYPAGFAGYSPGITVFEATPVAGSYSLSVLVPAVNTQPVTYSASATLSSTAALPALPAPTFTLDGSGGGSGTVDVPAGVTETMVYIVDVNGGGGATYYSVGPLTGTGTLNFSLPDTLGACAGTSCQSGSGAALSISPGDAYFISAIGYDYPAFEASPPGNTQQKPTITGANGQADITMSPVTQATAP